MKIPDDLERFASCYRLLKGSEIIAKFFYQDIWKECYIPKELKDRNWVPDMDSYYRCWWRYVDPADPADPGFSILLYVEKAFDALTAKKVE